ncbi:MAG TPA: ParA family protein [Hellea balneolensis]|uniref:Chromosome partitioning protein ParA n=1 Tax=Hellea balneolensis TaxID=287478 RepID=A0A7C5LU03_9PROT|nr:ParA family protein [Hellea balneolensis]
MDSQTRTIAIVNQKGGVGKTTTSINLAAGLAAHGQRVLLIDLDPQGNATTGLAIKRGATDITLYDVLADRAPLNGAIMKTQVKGLDIVASDMDLSGIETVLGTTEGRTVRLKTALADHAGHYDYVLIDCPPALGLLTVNALAAASSVIVPLQCEFFALEGLSQLLRTVETAKSSINPALVIDGVMLTMYDKRNRLSEQVAADVRKHLGRAVFKTIIPRNVRVAEAPSFGLPVTEYDPSCVGAQAYLALAKEILSRHKRTTKREL